MRLSKGYIQQMSTELLQLCLFLEFDIDETAYMLDILYRRKVQIDEDLLKSYILAALPLFDFTGFKWTPGNLIFISKSGTTYNKLEFKRHTPLHTLFLRLEVLLKFHPPISYRHDSWGP